MKSPPYLHIALMLLNAAGLFGFADLSAINNLDYSPVYSVVVDDVEKPVYESRASYQKRGGTIEQGNGITRMSFVNFDLPEDDAPQTVLIQFPHPASQYEIRPYSSNVQVGREDSTMTLTLNAPVKLVIKELATWDNVLCVFANPWHKKPCSCGVRYFFGEPRVYDYYSGSAAIDPSDPQRDLKDRADVRALDLQDGDKVYIAEGAVVRCRFNVPNNATVEIYGRGMLAYGLGHHENFGVIAANLGPKQVTLSGITICDAPGWNIRIFGGRDHHISNIKTVGFWHFNTDGMQFGGENSVITDCFLECNDDNFSFSGGGKRIRIYNNILWNIYNGGVFNFGWGNPQYQDIEIFDNTILRYGDCCGVDPNNPTPEVERRKAPFTMITYGGEKMDGIHFSDITVEEIIGKGEWLHFIHLQDGDGYVRNLTFSNISILNQDKVWGILKGTSGGGISQVTFENISINGEEMQSAEQAGLVLENATDIRFTAASGIEAATRQHDPGQCTLYPNSPNPFNPATRIRYYLKEPGSISLKIYTAEGRLAAILHEGWESAGSHQQVWDAKRYSAGVYFMRLETARQIRTQKMLLIK